MLQIVDDQHFGGAQLFLEGQRVLAIERAQEMAHEILGAQEQGALAALAEFQRRGIQKMGFAEAEAAMDVEQRNIALLAFGKGARRAMAEFIGRAGNEAVEGLLGMQHPRPQALGAVFLAAFGARRQIGDIAGGQVGRLARDMRIAADAGRRRRHHDGQRSRLGALGAEGALDAGDIMVGDPVAHKRLGWRRSSVRPCRRIPGSKARSRLRIPDRPIRAAAGRAPPLQAAGQSGRIGLPVKCPIVITHSLRPACGAVCFLRRAFARPLSRLSGVQPVSVFVAYVSPSGLFPGKAFGLPAIVHCRDGARHRGRPRSRPRY